MIRYHRRFIDPKNQYRRWIDPRVRALRLADVTAYLTGRGWTQVASDRPGFLIFQEPLGPEGDGGPYYQFVPETEEGSDYPLRMFELLTGLAELEDRQAAAVIDDMVRHPEPRDPNGVAREQPLQSEVVRE